MAEPLIALRPLILAGVEYPRGSELPDSVHYNRRDRPLDRDALLGRGDACRAEDYNELVASDEPEDAAPVDAGAGQPLLASVAQGLGLPEDATEAEILEAILALEAATASPPAAEPDSERDDPSSTPDVSAPAEAPAAPASAEPAKPTRRKRSG